MEARLVADVRGTMADMPPTVPLPVIGVVRSRYTSTESTPSGVDLIDGTPVLDIKPYVTRFDRPPSDPRCGWFDDIPMRAGSMPDGLGPAG
jgi:tRNA-methyltransferase O